MASGLQELLSEVVGGDYGIFHLSSSSKRSFTLHQYFYHIWGTLGFSCATCATCYPLIPIGKPKSTVAHCASVRHSGVPLKRSVS